RPASLSVLGAGFRHRPERVVGAPDEHVDDSAGGAAANGSWARGPVAAREIHPVQPVVEFQPFCQRPPSVPITKTSTWLVLHDAESGPDVSTPPRFSQPLHPPTGFHHLCHSALSVPRTNTSIHCPEAQASDPGSEVKIPPSRSQPNQFTPPSSDHLCHSALSVPRT